MALLFRFGNYSSFDCYRVSSNHWCSCGGYHHTEATVRLYTVLLVLFRKTVRYIACVIPEDCTLFGLCYTVRLYSIMLVLYRKTVHYIACVIP